MRSGALEGLAGLVLLVAGSSLYDWRAGLIVAGALLLFGGMMQRRRAT